MADTNETFEMAQLRERNRALADQLAVSNNAGKLPEYLFVSNFLPYFCGERLMSANPNVFPMWVSIAGSATSEVDILNDRGETIFSVPALVDLSTIDPVRKPGDASALGQIAGMAKMHANQTPTAGTNYMNAKLAEKFNKIVTRSETFTTNQERWNAIFARYGKGARTVATNSPTTESSGKLTDDDMVF